MKKKLVVIAAAAGIAAILAGGAGLYFMTAPSLTFARKWEQGETEGLGIPQEEIDEFTRLHPDCILYIVE